MKFTIDQLSLSTGFTANLSSDRETLLIFGSSEVPESFSALQQMAVVCPNPVKKDARGLFELYLL
jgi:hypothetical protein